MVANNDRCMCAYLNISDVTFVKVAYSPLIVPNDKDNYLVPGGFDYEGKTFLCSGNRSNLAYLVDLDRLEVIKTLNENEEVINDCKFIENGALALTCSDDDVVCWDVRNDWVVLWS